MYIKFGVFGGTTSARASTAILTDRIRTVLKLKSAAGRLLSRRDNIVDLEMPVQISKSILTVFKTVG